MLIAPVCSTSLVSDMADKNQERQMWENTKYDTETGVYLCVLKVYNLNVFILNDFFDES